MRRMLTIVVVAVLLAAGQVALPAAACACGGFAPRPGDQVGAGGEQAILSWGEEGRAGGRERIDLLLDVATDATETGLIFPTPAPATVTASDRADFAAVADEIVPTRETEYDWWGGGGDGAGAPGGAPDILAQVQLGPVQATTLAADDAAGLTDWLDDNGYGIAPEVSALFAGYVERGWAFVALKIAADEALDGALDPLRFEFDSDELVYPLELSRAATTPQSVKLYVVDDGRARVAPLGADAQAISQTDLVWAGPVAGERLRQLGEYLTVVEFWFADPPTQIPGDLVAVRADDDTPVAPIEHRRVAVEVLGMPLGPVLVGLGLLLVAGAVLLVLRRPSRRPGPADSRASL